MRSENRSGTQAAYGPRRPIWVTIVAVLVALCAVAALVGGVALSMRPPEAAVGSAEEATVEEGQAAPADGPLWTILATVVVTGLLAALAWGLWSLKDWARTGVMLVLGGGLLYYFVTVLFGVFSQIFAGERVVSWGEMFTILAGGLLKVVAVGLLPGAVIYALIKLGFAFEVASAQRSLIDRGVRYLLLATALSAILIVFLIILFTLMESWTAIEQIGLDTMLLGTIWRPGSIIGTADAQFGLVPMIVGSILSTFGAAVLGVPLSIGAAVLLAEIAPRAVREIVRPAIELLAGIPSVIYGLFGMVVLAPLIRKIQVPYNTGFGLLNASIVLAVMIVPTITNIAEDAIRAVPRVYKEGALALGSTHWQTIRDVILPAARSGIVAAVILGIGRALGETMAMIMVIGNSIAIPEPLNDNPLTLFLSSARTLTGNIAVEINYAAGAHRSALFFTGVLLFVMIMLVNSLARFLMRERLA
jgi:phosphate transport system permease protein